MHSSASMDAPLQYRSPKQRYTLRDVYNAAKFEKNFNYAFWLNVTFDILGAQLMAVAGYCLVSMATALIAGISALGFLVVIPAITSPGSIAQWCHIIWGLFLVFCIYFNYFLAVLTKPGSPRECAVPQMVPAETTEQQEANDNLKLCKKCNYTKPKRTHHCSICNQCVMKMDHHCPWVSNCVGYRNYRYFFSFLFWVTLAVLYVACISGSKVFSAGSILFPGPGKPSLFHSLLGGKQRNIYSILYDMLSDSGEHRDSTVRRTPRSPRSTKRLRAHPKDADTVPADAVHVPDTVETLEHRHLGVTSDNTVADTPDYIDFKAMSTQPLKTEHSTPASESSRVLTNVMVTQASLPVVAQEFNEDHHAGRTSLHQQPDHAQWRQGSLLSWIAPDEVLVFLAFMTSLGVSFGTGMLLFLHVFLLSSGYTTIEYFESTEVMKHCKKNNIIYKHPYDRGFWANFAEVFGPLPWYLALLPSTREPPAAFYLTQDKCATGVGTGSGTGRCVHSYGTELIENSIGGAQTSPVLRTSVSAGQPLWERNSRSAENLNANSDVEEGGKVHSR